MEENKQKNSRRRLNSLILLVAFTAIMLIVSTYAWFSTQRNVLIKGLTGEVKVAEGMQISLDATHWSSTIDLSTKDIVTDAYTNITGSDQNTYTNSNLKVNELQPVSTVGTDRDVTDIAMYRGTNTESIILDSIAAVKNSVASTDEGQNDPSKPDYPGYFAFDLFIQNSGLKEGDTQGTTVESLQLDSTSSVTVKASGGNSATGLQNTPRVAFAKFSGTADVGAENATQVLPSTNSTTSKITDIAIWEPNSDKHVTNIVNSNNYIIWNNEDKTSYNITAEADTATGISPFADGQVLPTYGLTSAAVGKKITNIYNWSKASGTPAGTDQGYLAKQNVVATPASNDKVMYLKSTTDGSTDFEIVKNAITKLRIYVWLEGQDVDTTNYASHGGGITVNIGLVKSFTDTSLLGNTSSGSANNKGNT